MNELKDNLAKLVFDFQLANIRNLGESQTRLSFIDKFWNYLGWDVSNLAQVQVEVTDRKHQRPDYRFMKGRNKVAFFVEAKKPAEDLHNPRHIYQTKLYCWNGSVPMAVLTDFEEFRPFRAIGKPKPEDWNKGLIKQFDITYEAYPDLAHELLNNFGREAVLGGSLDALVKPTKLELRDTVDKHFLNSLSIWRTELATQINKSNNFANEFEISEAIQRILDRLVFLRILQDRDIETIDYIRLISSFKVGDVYAEFVKICKQLAPKYNGLIFNPHPLSENLKVESTLFKKIVKELVYEDSPYRFDEMPVETLGTIYERFLGDEINLDKKGKVVIDAKPEVRKAGGVYYTPQYIVEYIVQNTVGKLLEKCKTPDEVSKIKILDPACGSGSFLLGAFDLLIKWHEDYFSANPGKALEKSGKQSYLLAYPDKAGQTKLTARMKGKILQNNIYGVDLDKQATEVAQMSLYIKVLEGMANESQMSLGFRDAILPKLDDNIKCGNSLIGTDFIHDDFFGLSEKERHKINPFDWEENFPFIKETGGFDAVIGNPPYGALFSASETNFLLTKYKYQNYQLDSYLLFIERIFSIIIRKNGILGFIIPNTWLLNLTTSKIRTFVFATTEILNIVHYQIPVFSQAVVDTEIILLKNNIPRIDHEIQIDIFDKQQNKNVKVIKQKNWIDLNGSPVNILDSEVNQSIKSKITKEPILDIICKITQGTKPFQVGKGIPKQTRETVNEKPFVSEIKKDELFRPLLRGSLINRYQILWDNNYWIKFGDWLAEPRYSANYDSLEKIVIRQTGDNLIASIDRKQFIVRDNLYTIVKSKDGYNLIYILGLINSKFLRWYYQNILNPEKGEALAQVKRGHIALLPIHSIDFSNPKEKAQHDKMVELVERMLKLHKDLHTASDFDRKHIETYIKNTDKEIDTLVYELYGLTDEEISIIENG